jgi:hypothetical protein
VKNADVALALGLSSFFSETSDPTATGASDGLVFEKGGTVLGPEAFALEALHELEIDWLGFENAATILGLGVADPEVSVKKDLVGLAPTP